MGVIQQVYKTVSCDFCSNTVTYDGSQEQADKIIEESTPWMRTLRLVQTKQGRVFSLCSDKCDLEHIATGARNPEERKQIVLPQGANAQQIAVENARRAEATTKAIKAGGPVTL